MIDRNESENELYKDANNVVLEESVPDIDGSLEQCTEAFVLMIENQFNKAIASCDKWAQKSLYHIHTKSTLQYSKALLTLENSEMEKAFEISGEAGKMCDEIRKSNSVARSLSNFVFSTNYDNYSEDEIFAEIIHAEQLLMNAVLNFFADQSIMSLLRGGFRIRSANNKYKECLTILDKRKNWRNDKLRAHFESATLFGNGVLNLVISHLPLRVIRFLEFIGFSGSRSLALKQLTQEDRNDTNWRSIPIDLFICIYECYIEQLFGLGKGDLDKAEEIVDRNLKQFEESAWFLWLKGKILQLRGNIYNAIRLLNQCLNAQQELQQLINMSNWELLWSYAVICDWNSAAKYANILRQECSWSPATFAYQEATFLYMQMIDQDKPELKSRIDELFRLVPTLKIRYGGKTIPPEKFACVNAQKYFERDEKLVLPAFELFYIWNIFAILTDNKNLVKPIIERIDKQLHEIKEKDLSDGRIFEDYAKTLFLKSLCLKEMKEYSEAEKAFIEILENEKRITEDTFILPIASLELGLVKIGLNSTDEAKIWLKRARDEYTGYLLETTIHCRIQRALQSIKSHEKRKK